MKLFKVRIFSFICLLMGAMTASVYAQVSVSEEVRQQAMSTQLKFWENTLKVPPTFEKNVEVQKKEEQKASKEDQNLKFLVKRIMIEDNKLFNINQLMSDADQLEGKMMSLHDLQAIADRITRCYQKHGYTMSRAYIPKQKIVDGVVTIKVLEVLVGEVSVTGNRWFKRNLYWDALKMKSGDYFDIADLESSLRQVNTQPDRFVKAYLEPGKEVGTTDIQLKAEEHNPVHVSYEYNLRGTELTGHSRHIMHYTNNNVSGRADRLQFSLTTAERAALYSEFVHYELPIARTMDIFHVDFGHAQSRLQKDLRSLDVRGQSVSFIPGFTHTYVSNPRIKLEGDIRFEIKDSKTDVGDDKLSFDRTRTLVAGPRFTFFDGLGRTYSAADMHVGIPNFLGSLKAHDDLSSRPKSGGSFVYWTLNAARIQRLPLRLVSLSQVSGQYSPSAVPSIEQMYLGGMYSVRGYAENEAAGDSGFSFSEELRIPIYCLPQDWKVFGLKDKTWADTLSLATFIDAGRTFDHKRQEEGSVKNRTLFGTGVGLRLYLTPDANAQFDMGFPLGEENKDKHDVQYHLSARLGF